MPKLLNPEHPMSQFAADPDFYHKILILLVNRTKDRKLVITAEDIEKLGDDFPPDEGPVILALKGLETGIELSLITEQEGEKIVQSQRH